MYYEWTNDSCLHTNETCLTCEWVMSHLRMSHVPHINWVCPTYECVMSHLHGWVMSHYDRVMSHTQITRMNTKMSGVVCVCVRVCACVYVCVCVYMYIHIYIYILMYKYILIHIYTYEYTLISQPISLCIYIHIWIRI